MYYVIASTIISIATVMFVWNLPPATNEEMCRVFYLDGKGLPIGKAELLASGVDMESSTANKIANANAAFVAKCVFK